MRAAVMSSPSAMVIAVTPAGSRRLSNCARRSVSEAESRTRWADGSPCRPHISPADATLEGHYLHGIFLWCNTRLVNIDWPAEFGRWLDRVEDDARSGNKRSRLILAYTVRALDQLRNLPGPPSAEDETATLRQVRQSRRYQLCASRTPTTRKWPSG